MKSWIAFVGLSFILIGHSLGQVVALTKVSYAIDVQFFIKERSIKGTVVLTTIISGDQKVLALDMHDSLHLDQVMVDGVLVKAVRTANKLNVPLPTSPLAKRVISVAYHGQPLRAVKPPWQGGVVWSIDKLGRPWVGVACQNVGSGVWFPSLAGWGDKAAPVTLRLTYPSEQGLYAVGNGTQLNDSVNGAWRTTTWHTAHAISPYNINFTIGALKPLHSVYQRPDGTGYDTDLYMLDYDTARAKMHFSNLHQMLGCIESKFGPYPFPIDGYALVETPYVGMEHQSAVAYGDGLVNNSFGFDFILLHESLHEWWGNAVTAASDQHMWVNEGFCTYAEYQVLSCWKGDSIADSWLDRQRTFVLNKLPIANRSSYDFRDTDPYYKAAWFIHTMRHALDPEGTRWESWIRRFQDEVAFAKTGQVLTTPQVIAWWSKVAGVDLKPAAETYLYTAELPCLQLDTSSASVRVRWKNKTPGLAYELGQDVVIADNRKWQRLPIQSKETIKKLLAGAQHRFLFDIDKGSKTH